MPARARKAGSSAPGSPKSHTRAAGLPHHVAMRIPGSPLRATCPHPKFESFLRIAKVVSSNRLRRT